MGRQVLVFFLSGENNSQGSIHYPLVFLFLNAFSFSFHGAQREVFCWIKAFRELISISLSGFVYHGQSGETFASGDVVRRKNCIKVIESPSACSLNQVSRWFFGSSDSAFPSVYPRDSLSMSLTVSVLTSLVAHNVSVARMLGSCLLHRYPPLKTDLKVKKETAFASSAPVIFATC